MPARPIPVGGNSRAVQPLVWSALAAAAIPVALWWSSVGDLGIYLQYETPPGQVWYVLSKLAGMYAFFLIWLQAVLGLVFTAPGDGRSSFWSVRFHRNLGLIALICIATHATLFILAASVRTHHVALGWLVPKFAAGYYETAVSLGALAFYTIVVVAVAGYLRSRRVMQAVWVHRASIPAVLLALTHCLMIGTETRSYLALASYGTMLVILLACLAHRLRRGSHAQPVR